MPTAYVMDGSPHGCLSPTRTLLDKVESAPALFAILAIIACFSAASV